MSKTQATITCAAKVTLVLVFLLLFQNASATHLFGGYISYQYLGNDRYEVKLRVYRDCNPGNVQLDQTVDLLIMDDSYQTLWMESVEKGPTVPVTPVIDTCMMIPPGLCLEYADYIDTINLPPVPGGYMINYRECCRNELIANIPIPLGTSYAYETNIPGNDTAGNSSPNITVEPPMFLCLNEPIDFALQTSEPDGDSLHFELCDILSFTSAVGNSPPYPISFLPGYSSQYPMDASPSFAVDPQTGEIRGTPTQMGHYVVGICISEYRDGAFLSTVRFDYQFNVANCQYTKSDFLTTEEDPGAYCGGLSVKFTDESIYATDVFWDFGDTTTLADTSHARYPSYSYPDFGSYTVQLIASRPGCTDTTEEVIEVREGITPDFFTESTYCFSDQPLIFSPEGTYPDSVSYEWNFGAGANVRSSLGKESAPVSWNAPGEHEVELVVKQGGCSYVTRQTIELLPQLAGEMVLPTENPGMTCNGLTIPFQVKTANVESVYWDFGVQGTTADTSYEDSVSFTYPRPGKYQVKLFTTREGSCSDTSVFTIETHDPLRPRVEVDGSSCFEAGALGLSAAGDYPSDTKFTWEFDSSATVPVMWGSSVSGVSWKYPGKHPIHLIVEKGYCKEEVFDTVEVRKLTVPVEAGDTQRVYEGERFNLQASADAEEYYWYSDQPAYISSPFSQNTSVDLRVKDVDSIIKFYVHVTDAAGCEGIDSTFVILDIDDSKRLYNFISPNDDGRNDFFDISSLMGGDDCKLTIMNRWGSEVYHAQDYQNDWKGVDDEGNLLPDGTYYYIIYCTPTVRATGPITIIRSRFR